MNKRGSVGEVGDPRASLFFYLHLYQDIIFFYHTLTTDRGYTLMNTHNTGLLCFVQLIIFVVVGNGKNQVLSNFFNTYVNVVGLGVFPDII